MGGQAAPSRSGGREPDREEWRERGRRIVIRQLSMMDRSRQQLSEAMERRDVPADVREEVLDHFTSIGLIDDAHFARALVRTRLSETGASRKAMCEELRRKGVDHGIVDAVIESVGDEAELEAAVAVAEKRLSRGGGDPRTLDRRVYAALARRGYPPETCSRALREAHERLLG